MAKRFIEFPRHMEELGSAKEVSGSYSSGDDVINLAVVEWYVKEGDTLKEGKLIVSIETDKTAYDIEVLPEEDGARVLKILVPASSETIKLQSHELPLRLAEIEKDAWETDVKDADTHEIIEKIPDKAMDSASHPESGGTEGTETEIPPAPPAEVRAAPATRRLARELGVDINLVKPNRRGVVKEKDVWEHFDRLQAKKGQDKARDDYEVLVPHLRWLTTAKNTQDAWQMIPHAGPAIDINPDPLLILRKSLSQSFLEKHGLKLRIENFFVMAVSFLLSDKRLRILNAYWHEEGNKAEVRLYKHVNVGLAIAIPAQNTRSGFSELVVSSVKKAETLSFVEMSREIERLVADGVSGKPKIEDLNVATCVVNNTGAPVKWSEGEVYSGSEIPFSVMAPNTSMMLSFGAARKVARDRLMHLALRFDHRVCNGNEATLFLRKLQELIEYPKQILELR